MAILANIPGSEMVQSLATNQDLLIPIKQIILDNFGQNGLYAAYLLAIALVILILHKLVKLGFQLIFMVVLPAVISAFVLDIFMPYDFFYLLPVTTALFTLGLVLRNVGPAKG